MPRHTTPHATTALLAFARIVSIRCRNEVRDRGTRMPHETEQLLLTLAENAELFLTPPAGAQPAK